MTKTLIGSRLRKLRLENKQTQAQMADALNVSASYINLLENNQRSLSVKMLMSLSDVYGIDWRELTESEDAKALAALRQTLLDPIFGTDRPDLQELRAAVDHAPVLVEHFVQLYSNHRTALDKILQLGDRGAAEELMQTSPETIIHDFFRDHGNHFPALETAAEDCRARRPNAPEDHFASLKTRLAEDHSIRVIIRPMEEMDDTLRAYDADARVVNLSQVLDTPNRVFQLVHVLALIEYGEVLEEIMATSGITMPSAQSRLKVELANYFAAAYLMPYAPFLKAAERARYDIDRIAAAFTVAFEQVCQRLTTLQRKGALGVPFFFMRIDKAGNVMKRFNSTSFQLAEYGGACPIWNVHSAFHTPGVTLPQFVELPDGARFFTISRTVHRPVFSLATQDRRLVLALGCDIKFADRVDYAARFNLDDPTLFAPIGINCHICPRQACSQRAHQPLFLDLPLDANRRGSTRYES